MGRRVRRWEGAGLRHRVLVHLDPAGPCQQDRAHTRCLYGVSGQTEAQLTAGVTKTRASDPAVSTPSACLKCWCVHRAFLFSVFLRL